MRPCRIFAFRVFPKEELIGPRKRVALSWLVVAIVWCAIPSVAVGADDAELWDTGDRSTHAQSPSKRKSTQPKVSKQAATGLEISVKRSKKGRKAPSEEQSRSDAVFGLEQRSQIGSREQLRVPSAEPVEDVNWGHLYEERTQADDELARPDGRQ